MAKYRGELPQLGDDGLFLTDGGLETTLVFHDGLDLPHFAAFDLMKEESGREAIKRYFRNYASIARNNDRGIVLESPTWRASSDWGDKLGYSAEELSLANQQSIALMDELRQSYDTPKSPIVISGCLGPRGDGYDPGDVMTADEAEAYHSEQIKTFAETAADLVTGATMTNIPESIGITRAAQAAGMPVVISFTVETDGKLPTGETLKEAVEAVDAATAAGPEYFMINCAHPDHFDATIATGETWIKRIKGLRANASRQSHAELDAAEELDDGDPDDFGRLHAELHKRFDHIAVMGGCCGTDQRHIEAICKCCGGWPGL